MDNQTDIKDEGTLLDLHDSNHETPKSSGQNKTCKQCGKSFTVEPDDLEFYKKISPTFGGKLFLIPSSNYCHDCRNQQRLAWRNERKLYKRKSDKSGADIVSIYSPNKKYIIYSNSEYNRDDWDLMAHGMDFDFSRNFAEQFSELIKKIPRLSTNSIEYENSEYTNFAWNIKDCYLTTNAGFSERIMYSSQIHKSKDCLDCFDIKNCEICYECFNCNKCYNCRYLEGCEDCTDSSFSYNCSGCSNVFLCSNLNNKNYCIENKQYSKEEYLEILKKYNLNKRSSLENILKKFTETKNSTIHKTNYNVMANDCKGDYLRECKNCLNTFNTYQSENCDYCCDIDSDGKDTKDLNNSAQMELCYHGISVAGYKNIFCFTVVRGNDNMYCDTLQNCKNCFGCSGLRNKQYCILNKQYSKEEYEDMVAKIIEHMQKTGEWGEYFPMNISPFGYNETMANEYYPLGRDEALKLGVNWEDENFESKHDGEYIIPQDDINYYVQNPEEVDKLLAGIVKCEISNNPFKIMPQELAFYMEHGIPVPVKKYDVRYAMRFKLRNPRVLYESQCDCVEESHGHHGRCTNQFESTYNSTRQIKVYCEACYRDSVRQ